MWRYLPIPFYSFFIMMAVAGSVGNIWDWYAPKNMFEEYLVIMSIAFVLTTVRIIHAKTTKNRRPD